MAKKKKQKQKQKQKQRVRPSSVTFQSGRNEFKPDYSTTKRDLRRIAILAGTFIAILIVLSFFQDQLLALFVK